MCSNQSGDGERREGDGMLPGIVGSTITTKAEVKPDTRGAEQS